MLRHFLRGSLKLQRFAEYVSSEVGNAWWVVSVFCLLLP